MSSIDLHIHSKYSSDGELSVSEIMKKCRRLNMQLVSITDHNSVRGVAAAIKNNAGIQVISGIELDCTYKGENFHLLGYDFDYTRKEFAHIEQDILLQEKKAGEKRICLFRNSTGIPISVQEVLLAADGNIVTGELIAEIVLSYKNAANYGLLKPYLAGGEKSDMPNVRFYWDFFSPGKPAYVPINYISLSDAVKLIKSAGGKTVLAHPGQNLNDDISLLHHIIDEGIDGIEVFSSYHSPEDMACYYEISLKNHLFATCGSDFHGKHKPQIHIGGHGAYIGDESLMESLDF